MKKIISILGSTAVGKTSFALKMAMEVLLADNRFFSGVDLISADSRQVYKGLEILSGADVPEGFEKVVVDIKGSNRIVDNKLIDNDKIYEDKSTDYKSKKYPFFEKQVLFPTSTPDRSKVTIDSSLDSLNDSSLKIRKDRQASIRLYGVTILKLADEWSVAHFKNFATEIIENSIKNNRLPILVGGTGLYHKHLFSSDINLYVAPNEKLRAKAKKMSLEELQNWLKDVDPIKLNKMNNSDINNPRRLIRAIEVSTGNPDIENIKQFSESIDVYKIGLFSDLETINQKIYKRVVARFNDGAIDEVKKVISLCENKDLPVCTTLGVSDISSYISGDSSKEECLSNWTLHEFQYAKRQMVWWKKEDELVWLDDLAKSSYTLDREFLKKI